MGEGRRIMNVNKRKIDSANGPVNTTPSSPSSSRTTAITASPRGPRSGLPTPPTSLPPRPTAVTTSPGSLGAPSAPRADRTRQPPLHLKGRSLPSRQDAPGEVHTSDNSAPPVGALSKDDGAPRSAKRPRMEGRKGGPGEGGSVASSSTPSKGGAQTGDILSAGQPAVPKPIPSLLSRLNPGAQNGKAAACPTADREQSQVDRNQGRRGRGDSERTDTVVPAKRRAESAGSNTPVAPLIRATVVPLAGRNRLLRPSPEPDKAPVGGYSIRGAAKAAIRSSPSEGDSPAKGPTSLLQRLQPVGGAQISDDGARRRKKGRHT
ncbi:hypothetical protein BC628DRAFT_1064513 [Trametes gibbosa]|nr:hypothetical protein BC628DRAFT_1064513 [Trametes gibbosa]